MKKLVIFLTLGLPVICLAADYQSTLLVQTGKLRESDLIIRTITDLESSKICLTFYIRTVGTSPVMTCYDALSGFRSKINQVGRFIEGKLVVRKVRDEENSVSCLVAYASTPGTSPAIDCYTSKKIAKDAIVRSGHLREGDLDVYKLMDPESTKTCLVAFVSSGGTSPTLACYNSLAGSKGGMVQNGQLREGDLLVRKIVDQSNQRACLITYVSTEGTSPHIFCFSEKSGAQPEASGTYPPLPDKRR
jgi:hypothetical protein